MPEITMTIPDQSLANIGTTPAEIGDELRMLAAVKLFELKKLSSSAAAQLAGVSRLEFLHRLAAYGVPTFQQTEDELLEEIRNA